MFLVPGQKYCDINYKLLIEQLFPSIKEVTLERRRMPHVADCANNDTLFFVSKSINYEFPELMELPSLDMFKNKDEYDYYRLDRALVMQDRPSRQYTFEGISPDAGKSWLHSQDKMLELLAQNRIVLRNGVVFVKRYRSECLHKASDVWKDEGSLQLTGNTSIGSDTMNKILKMCIPNGGNVLIPFERDGKFTYMCNSSGIGWTSIYTPIVEGRRDYLQEIEDDSYMLLADMEFEHSIQNNKNIVASTRAVKKIQSQNLELVEENEELQSKNADLRKENEELRNKVNSLLESIKKIQLSIGMDENDEVTIDGIIERIHNQTLDIMSDMNFEEYIPKAQEWIAPHWKLLESESQQFIPTGLMLGELLDKIGDGGLADKAPVVIEYCKTLEKELFQKIFYEYVKCLIGSNVNVYQAFRDSFERNEYGKLRKSKVFADFLKDATTRNRNKPEEWHFEIGKMARVLIMTLEGKEPDAVFVDFRGFLEKIFHEEFFEKEFAKRLDEIADLRNKCAHPNVVDEVNASNGKAVIQEKLSDILRYYK